MREQTEREAARAGGAAAAAAAQRAETQRIKKRGSAGGGFGVENALSVAGSGNGRVSRGGVDLSGVSKAERARLLEQRSRKTGPFSEEETSFQDFFGGGESGAAGGWASDEGASVSDRGGGGSDEKKKKRRVSPKPLALSQTTKDAAVVKPTLVGLPSHIAEQIRAQRLRHPHRHHA